jgi:uncharacterized membrane protein YedE/YeeE
MSHFFALLVGLIFGLGLILSGMTNPAKVQGFLDLTGNWDPSLAFVMLGAISVATVGFLRAKQVSLTWAGSTMSLPQAGVITPRLIWGSVAFGAGWGLAGFCPGPALVSLGAGEIKAVVFVTAMVAGMGLFEWIQKQKS